MYREKETKMQIWNLFNLLLTALIVFPTRKASTIIYNVKNRVIDVYYILILETAAK